jgi:hypothetical protein
MAARKKQETEMDLSKFTEVFKAIIDAEIDFEQSPTIYQKTRNGWAGYRGTGVTLRRITRFYFSEDGAREAVIARDSSSVKVVF